MKEYDTPMFTAHRSIGKSSENLLGFASEVFFGFSILLLALNIGIYHTPEPQFWGMTILDIGAHSLELQSFSVCFLSITTDSKYMME